VIKGLQRLLLPQNAEEAYCRLKVHLLWALMDDNRRLSRSLDHAQNDLDRERRVRLHGGNTPQ
jgi:hypothetical protein